MTRYRVAELASACVGATALAARALHAARGGPPAGPVHVDTAHALASFRSERSLVVDGAPVTDLWAALSGDYATADGWVRLHANYPHHAVAIRAALGLRPDTGPDETRAAVAALRADDVERRVLDAGGAAAALRPPEAWAAHPAGIAVRAEPLVAVERVGDAPPRPPAPSDRPARGVRVLELTHVIAGPVCGRVLAGYGADVLHVGAAHLPVIPPLAVDTGFGKRSCHLDLRGERDRSVLSGLWADADVLVQSYRPGSLARKGFGAHDQPEGTVLVEFSAYGHTGPWAARRGFDSLVQMATGIAWRASGPPVPLPAQALDHGTGWLAAQGTLIALRRRAVEGGTWRVRVSLARTAAWLDSLGRGDREHEYPCAAPYVTEMDSAFGLVGHVRFPDGPGWDTPPPVPGGGRPEWVSPR